MLQAVYGAVVAKVAVGRKFCLLRFLLVENSVTLAIDGAFDVLVASSWYSTRVRPAVRPVESQSYREHPRIAYTYLHLWLGQSCGDPGIGCPAGTTRGTKLTL